MSKSREQQLYEELLKYNVVLRELEKMSDKDLLYYYSYNLIQEEMKYLEQLLEEQREISTEENSEEKEQYEDRINEQGDIITKDLTEISKTDPKEIKKEISTKLIKKYSMFNDIMVGANLKDALDGKINIDDEISDLDKKIGKLEKSLILFDNIEKYYDEYINYSDNLKLFEETTAWKNISNCVDKINFYGELIEKDNNKYVEYDYYYNNALECKEEYDNLKFYKKLSKHGRELKKEIRETNNYYKERDNYKKNISRYTKEYNKYCISIKNCQDDFNYYSEKLFKRTIGEDEECNEVLLSFYKKKNELADRYENNKKELANNLKTIFKDEKVIDRKKIIVRLDNLKETRKILKKVGYSDRFFKNNPDINKDKIRNVLSDSEKIKIPEKDMKKMILKLNLNKK